MIETTEILLRDEDTAPRARHQLPRKFERAHDRGTLRRALVEDPCVGRRGAKLIAIAGGTTGDLLIDCAQLNRPAYWFRPDGTDAPIRVSRDRLTFVDPPLLIRC